MRTKILRKGAPVAEKENTAGRKLIGSIVVESDDERPLEVVEVGDFTRDALNQRKRQHEN